MSHLVNENFVILLLAGFSGFDFIKRAFVRISAAVMALPLKCYMKVAAAFALGKTKEMKDCGCGG